MTHFIGTVIVPAGTDATVNRTPVKDWNDHFIPNEKLEGELAALLAPFDENLLVEKFIELTREQAIAKERAEIESFRTGLYAQYLADPEAYAAKTFNPLHLQYLREEFPKKLVWTDEQCYEARAAWYESEDKDAAGNLYSERNPQSYWDWYTVGGRWGDSYTQGGTVAELRTLVQESDPKAQWVSGQWNLPNVLVFDAGNGAGPQWVTGKEYGWFGYSEDTADPKEWPATVLTALAGLPDDALVFYVDFHI